MRTLGGPRPITVEMGLYGLILLGAGVLRLARLDLFPLDAAESLRALSGWQWLHGQRPELWQEPATELATGITFLLFGDSDATARWLSAVLGMGLVALVWLVRALMGRGPALAAALLLALSPTLVYASRVLSGEIWGEVLTLLAALLLIRFRGRVRLPHLAVVAAMSVVLLQVGASGVTGLLTLGAFLALWAVIAPSAFREKFQQVEALPARRSLALLAGLFVGLSTVVGSGLFVHLHGIGLPGVLAWVQQFDPDPDGPAWYLPALRLLAYEPLASVFGLVGGALVLWRWRRGDLSFASDRGAFLLFLLLWAGVGLVLLLLAEERAARLFFAPIPPLTLLAAAFLGELTAAAKSMGWGWIAWTSGLFLALAGSVLLAFTQRSFSGAGAGWLLLLLATVGVGGLLFVWAFWPAQGGHHGTGEVILLLCGLVLLLFTWHNGWSLNYGVGESEWLGAPRSSRDMRELAEEVQRRANRPQSGAGFAIAVDGELRAPLAWYLRGLADGVSFQGVQPGASALLLKAPPAGEGAFSEYEPYRGLLTAAWNPPGASVRAWWRWLLLRETPALERSTQEMFLYLKGGSG